MSLSPLNNNAKKDTASEEIDQDIGGTDSENEQVIHETYDNAQGNRTVDIKIENVIMELPLNISINQIDEIFPKLDRVPFNENNYIAIINYLQTYHFALKQLEAQIRSANNTIQTYEEDIRQLNEFRDAVSTESSDYHTKMKELEHNNKLLVEYSKNLRARFAKFVGEQFGHAFERMKECDTITNILSQEFNYRKDEGQHKHE